MLNNFQHESDKYSYHNRKIDEIKSDSFERIIMLVTTALALVSLIFRNYLLIFWKDFNNPKELQDKLLSLELGKGTEEIEDEDRLNNLNERVRRRALSKIRRKKKFLERKESIYKKWL
jgi:hypothetical protein